MSLKTDETGEIFQCRKCGECCNGYGGTYVSQTDIRRISSFLGMDPATFTENFCTLSGSRHLISQGKDENCIFYDTQKQCTIHAVKPYMCRAWPFIDSVAANPENWNIMAGMCPGIKKNIPSEQLKAVVIREQKRLNSRFSSEEQHSSDRQ